MERSSANAESSPLIKAPQDFFGGLALVGLAIFSLWATSDLEGMKDSWIGAGTAPALFSWVLFIFGAIIAVTGMLFDGPRLQRFSLRGPFFVTAAVLAFSLSIQPLGLLISTFVSFLIAGFASPETRWKEAVVAGVLLTAVCGLLFPYALGLPFELFPRFLK